MNWKERSSDENEVPERNGELEMVAPFYVKKELPSQMKNLHPVFGFPETSLNHSNKSLFFLSYPEVSSFR